MVHSSGIDQKVLGADSEWQGKSIGFLRDCIKYATALMVDLGKNTAWAGDETLLPMDLVPLVKFYFHPENSL